MEDWLAPATAIHDACPAEAGSVGGWQIAPGYSMRNARGMAGFNGWFRGVSRVRSDPFPVMPLGREEQTTQTEQAQGGGFWDYFRRKQNVIHDHTFAQMADTSTVHDPEVDKVARESRNVPAIRIPAQREHGNLDSAEEDLEWTCSRKSSVG